MKLNNYVFSFDLEDYKGTYSSNGEYIYNTYKILDLLDSFESKGTFFTVTQVVKSCPSLIKEIHKRGHEIASHGSHIPLDKLTYLSFLKDTSSSKDAIENLIGESIEGYRAPLYSLTKQTTYALDALKELGFSYSSSVMPSKNPLYGMHDSPVNPFVWENGIIEFPCTVFENKFYNLPFLGGVYFRFMPTFLIKLILKNSKKKLLSFYMHPYDFGKERLIWSNLNIGIISSILLSFNRKKCLKKFENLIFDKELVTYSSILNDDEFVKKLTTYKYSL